MYIGVIADDFTGGTDIAGFLVKAGLNVIQYLGVPEGPAKGDPHAGVISLKSRSCAAEEAIADSLAAARWLRDQGCEQIFFKYCSTFDSTERGNIGPVTDALLDFLGSDFTVMAPALPVNGRTVYNGYLFVDGVPLNESGMRNHPLNPMRDANLMRLTEGQSSSRAANIPYPEVDAGAESLGTALERLRGQGIRYAVPDALKDGHLDTLALVVRDFPLVTGGSGLGAALARLLATRLGLTADKGSDAAVPPGGRAVILSGSASVMTNAQVEAYRSMAQSLAVDVGRALSDPDGHARGIVDWVLSRPQTGLAPLVYATTGPETLHALQQEHGVEASGRAVEELFAAVAAMLRGKGFDHFIVAGGETSGAVVQALGIKAFHIGPEIAPGVPWVRAVDAPISLALKSGNFGKPDFFSAAQEFFHGK